MFMSKAKIVMRAFVSIGQVVIGIVAFLSALAQIATFITNSPNVVLESIRNVFSKSAAAPRCARYDYQRRDGECDKMLELSQRLLCRITIQPLEKVCVDSKDNASH